ncbi:MAG: Clp protease N-terminal domain-containing protein [Acidimicrobiia bacterium]
MTPGPTLQDLIGRVQLDAPDEAPLTRLRTAAELVDDVTGVADATLGYFVDQARRAGHSWSEIGESLGVSKQAAQQRHARAAEGMTSVTFERFTDRARTVVALSESVARDLGHVHVGTEHVLLAQLSVPEAIAGQVLLEAGLTVRSVRRAIAGAATGRAANGGADAGAPPTEGRLRFTPRALQLFTGALAAALELGHNDIGTEHLLLGTYRTDGLAAEILASHGLDEATARAGILTRLAALAPAPEGTPAKRRPVPKKPVATKAAGRSAAATKRAGRGPSS